MSSRSQQLAEAHRQATQGNADKYNYVNVATLERLGILRYKIENGDNFVRIITPKFPGLVGDQIPPYWKEVHVHYNIGADNRTFICNKKMKGESCAVCDYIDKILIANPESQIVKDLYSSVRFLFFIYNVKNAETEAKGLHWFDAPKTFRDEVLALSKDKRTKAYIDVSTREEGKDIEFEKQGKGMTTKYVGFALKDNQVPPQSWYDNAPDSFDDFLVYPNYETVLKELPDLNAPRVDTIQDPSRTTPVTETRQTTPVTETRQTTPVTETRQTTPVTETRQTASEVESSVQQIETRGGETRGGETRGGEIREERNSNSAINPDVQARINKLRNNI